jgi:hypothetical protein
LSSKAQIESFKEIIENLNQELKKRDEVMANREAEQENRNN